MKRGLFTFVLVILIVLESSAKIYIPLVKSVPPSTGGGGDARTNLRTSSYAPMAYYENECLYIQFPASTMSSVIITNDSTEVAVISKNYDFEVSNIQINANTLNKQNAYNISVNAYGVWWVGFIDFRTASSSVEKTRKGFSAIIDESDEGRNYSILGVAGNATPGWNFGVSGFLSGQNEGTGIYGSSRYDEGFNTAGRFAGLFHGDIKTTDAVYASAYNTLADSRLNKNMVQLETGSLDNLMQMSVFKYDLRQFDVDCGEESRTLGYYNDDSGLLEREHYGLSGQEIKEIYPNLVSESQDGYLSVNYVEMIPLLIKSIQELKTEVETLKTGTKVSGRNPDDVLALHQSVPNPFSDRCVIKCTIPQNTKEASVYFFDYNGRQIQHRIIKDRGDVQLLFDGNGLEAGIYLYSLVADGVLIDTKRMIHIME